jgi:hypothetical protein
MGPAGAIGLNVLFFLPLLVSCTARYLTTACGCGNMFVIGCMCGGMRGGGIRGGGGGGYGVLDEFPAAEGKYPPLVTDIKDGLMSQ